MKPKSWIAGTLCVLLAAMLAAGSAPMAVHAAVQAGLPAGAVLFRESGCQHCHRMDGAGGELGPDLSAIAKHKTKQQISRQILEGGGAMPAFRDALQPSELQALIDYIRATSKLRGAARGAAAPEQR